MLLLIGRTVFPWSLRIEPAEPTEQEIEQREFRDSGAVRRGGGLDTATTRPGE
jgi:hypothetical protein